MSELNDYCPCCKSLFVASGTWECGAYLDPDGTNALLRSTTCYEREAEALRKKLRDTNTELARVRSHMQDHKALIREVIEELKLDVEFAQ